MTIVAPRFCFWDGGMTRSERKRHIAALCTEVCERMCEAEQLDKHALKRIKTEVRYNVNRSYHNYRSKVKFRIWKLKNPFFIITISAFFSALFVLVLLGYFFFFGSS